jgi:2,4-didehydro-3-deoxy-L-rhamnonate hydrolase
LLPSLHDTVRVGLGYVCINDVSDRSTQVDTEHRQHLVWAESRPTYDQIGPYLTTGINPMALDEWAAVIGRFEQKENTSGMIFPIHELLAYFSRHKRMVPGDILATGTTPGVGMGKNSFLAIDDILERGITNLGA